ncbi:Kazrin-A [Lucilia cuprina]|nr:Kazrin-A [Lucilia cuprina]
MQINIINTGPTMAASEPPEPPPRNPERINATLHKLAESNAFTNYQFLSQISFLFTLYHILCSAKTPAGFQGDRTNQPLNHLSQYKGNSKGPQVGIEPTTSVFKGIYKVGFIPCLKTLEMFDSSVLNDKTVNNNKPLKTILSLDTATSATTVASGNATTGKLHTTVNNLPSPSGPAGTIAASATGLYFNKQQHKIQQQNDLTPSGGESSTSPLSSNGSNHTLTSPMTIEHQQQQQLHRINYQTTAAAGTTTSAAAAATLIKGNSGSGGGLETTSVASHMTQQQNGSGQRGSGVGGLLTEQQQQQHNLQLQQLNNHHLINGGSTVATNTTTSAATGSSGSSLGSSSNNSNHSNSLSGSNAFNINNLITTHSTTAALTATHNLQTSLVDKRNANDICVIPITTTPTHFGTIMETSTETAVITTATPTKGTKTTAATMQFNTFNNCDGNRNNDIKFMIHNQHQQQQQQQYNCTDSPTKLREENERLNTEIHRLRKLLENSPEGAVGGIDLSDSNSCGDGQSTDGSGSNTQQRIDRLEQELRSAKNQLMSLRIERKKLRSDKNELVGQVKQLCVSLQEKEQELRDFIRNYQDRVRESESNNAKLTGDRERERWQLLKQARDEAERSLALAQQLSARDLQLQKLQEQLQRQMSGCMSDQESLLSFAPLTPPSAASGLLNQMPSSSAGVVNYRNDDSGRGNSNSLSAFSNSSGNTAGDRNSCSNDSVLRNNSDRESTGGDINFSDGISDNGPCITVDPDSISLVSSQNMYQYGTPKERSPTLSPLNSAAYSRSVEQLGSPVDSDGPGAVARKFAPKSSGAALGARNGRGGTWGSISRVFARSRNKNKALSADGATEYNDYSWSPLSEEGYAEKLRLLREASQIPMERWRASQVLAWLEVALGMPQYSTRCSENVKSGKVLLELNDIELEAGLGLAHPMHRKKLRLAIEEQRRPEMVRYPMITQLGHTWVASEWLPDIGLPQYAESFLHSLVDARMLDTLSKKELEKFLGVTRKFHQASIVHGIHVLRIVKYDRQTLAMRRVQSENVDTDPIVWTNQRFIRWARSIDLAEYADNLKDQADINANDILWIQVFDGLNSGVHGGLVVLEPSFSGDTMATALGIPPSKNIIRRHLSTEFDALILPARYMIYCQMDEFQVDNNSARQLSLNQKPPTGR